MDFCGNANVRAFGNRTRRSEFTQGIVSGGDEMLGRRLATKGGKCFEESALLNIMGSE